MVDTAARALRGRPGFEAGPLAGAPPPPRRLELYAACLAGSILCFTAATLSSGSPAWLLALIAPLGGTTCGWSWLFARRLFRPDATRDGWALGVVLTLAVSHLLLAVPWPAADPAGPWSSFARVAANLNGLASNAVLFLALAEGVRGYSRSLPRAERRLRQVFVTVYGGLVVVAVLWVSGADGDSFAGQAGDGVRLAAAWLALAGAAVALHYRRRHPLPPLSPSPSRGRPRQPARGAGDAALPARIRKVLSDPAVYTQPDLKVADVAQLLGEQEYKVTRCITGDLGYANFNRLVNTRRMELARRMLRDPALRGRSIACIALECGFGSIGTFNRVFKEHAGMTPSAYRRTHPEADAPLEDGSRDDASSRPATTSPRD